MNPAQDQRKINNPINLLILITLAGILLAVWYVTGYLNNQQASNVTWYPASDCQLPQDTCLVKLEKPKQLTFTLHKAEPKPLETLPLSVELKGYSDAELENLQVEIDLQGRDMYMGYNRTLMEYQGFGRFTANPILSICTEEVMVWRASVLINHTDQEQSATDTHTTDTHTTYGSYFDFTVITNP